MKTEDLKKLTESAFNLGYNTGFVKASKEFQKILKSLTKDEEISNCIERMELIGYLSDMNVRLLKKEVADEYTKDVFK